MDAASRGCTHTTGTQSSDMTCSQCGHQCCDTSGPCTLLQRGTTTAGDPPSTSQCVCHMLYRPADIVPEPATATECCSPELTSPTHAFDGLLGRRGGSWGGSQQPFTTATTTTSKRPTTLEIWHKPLPRRTHSTNPCDAAHDLRRSTATRTRMQQRAAPRPCCVHLDHCRSRCGCTAGLQPRVEAGGQPVRLLSMPQHGRAATKLAHRLFPGLEAGARLAQPYTSTHANTMHSTVRWVGAVSGAGSGLQLPPSRYDYGLAFSHPHTHQYRTRSDLVQVARDAFLYADSCEQ